MNHPNVFTQAIEQASDLARRDGRIDAQERAHIALLEDIALRVQAATGVLLRMGGVPRDVRRQAPAWLPDIDRDYPPAA